MIWDSPPWEADPLPQYDVIMADPPWRDRDQMSHTKTWSEVGIGSGGQYESTMSDEEIAALPVSKIVAPNAALFLWVTWPKLFDDKMVSPVGAIMKAWGFRYSTLAFVWIKSTTATDADAHGFGNWTVPNSEGCFLGLRGSPKRSRSPLAGEGKVAALSQVVRAPNEGHSQKPRAVRQGVEALFAERDHWRSDGPRRIELFGRQGFEDWDVWGNEVDPATQLKLFK